MKKYLNYIKKKVADNSYRELITIDDNRKIVSFTFDDVPKSAFDNAVPILNKYNLRGTFYIALSFLKGMQENDDLYSKAELQECLRNGNELASHSYSHFHFYNTYSSKFISNDLKKNHLEFEKLNLDISLENFSYPYGELTRLAKKNISRLYTTCRGLDHGINVGRVDLNSLKAIQLYECKNSLKKINDIFKRFKESGGWLIFYTHDVQESFSRYGCSRKYFECVVKKSLELGFEVKTIKEAVDLLEITKNKPH